MNVKRTRLGDFRFFSKLFREKKYGYKMSTNSEQKTKPTVWFHGPVEEDPQVGFNREQVAMIEEHFTVTTYTQLKQREASDPNITGVISNTHRSSWLSEQLPLMPNLKAIATYGAGINHLDLKQIKDRNIKLSNTPGVVDGPVADMAMALLLAAARKIPPGLKITTQKDPIEKFTDIDYGLDVTGTAVGIVGMGGIGTLVAKRCRGFDMNILYHNRRKAVENSDFPATYFANLNDMLPLCDYVVLSCPLTKETKGMIGEKELKLMKKTSVLVNVARGEVVDTNDLTNALEEGQIKMAALDVTYPEPLPRDHPLLRRDDVIITPHYGASVYSARVMMLSKCVNSLKAVLVDKAAMPDEIVL